MKKRILSLLLVFVLVIATFTACGKAPVNTDNTNKSENKSEDEEKHDEEDDDPIDAGIAYLSLRKTYGGDSQYDDNGDTYECRVRCEYAGLELQDEDADLYPELNNSLKALNQEIETLVTDEYDQYDGWSKESKANGEDTYFPYYIDRDMLVRRADTSVLSLSIPLSNYSGGAHGWYGDFPRSFDTKTGKEIKFVDIVKDIDKMYDYITGRLMEKYSEEWDMFIQFQLEDQDPYELYKNGTAEQGFYFGNEGITVIFNPYDLAAYAAGPQEIYIPYKGNEDLFADGRYFDEHLDDYAVGIQLGSNYCSDIFGDGKEDTFSFYMNINSDDYEHVDGLYFNVNGQSYNIEADFYSFDQHAYLVKNAEGKVFLYLLSAEFNDYSLIYVYEITPTSVNAVDEVGASMWAPAPEGDDWWSWGGIMTDPQHFYIQYRTDILGTTNVHTLAYVGSNGMPAEYNAVYEFGNRFELTLMKELKTDTVSESGEKTGTRTLSVGDVVKAYRTDNETYVDVLMNDGTIIRFNVTATYPFEIDGIRMDELMDGIMYAG